MAALRLGVLASGRGSDLQSLLDANDQGLIRSRVEVVISDVADAKALERARRKEIPAEGLVPDDALATPERRRRHEEQILKVLAHFKADLVILAGYMRILTGGFLQRYPHRVVNVHPALLPSFPGTQGQRQAIDYGVRIAGCTTHFVDDQVDHGPIILQAALAVHPNETAESVSERILVLEHQLLPRTVNLIEEGRVTVEGRIVRIARGPSWRDRLPRLPDVLYGDGY